MWWGTHLLHNLSFLWVVLLSTYLFSKFTWKLKNCRTYSTEKNIDFLHCTVCVPLVVRIVGAIRSETRFGPRVIFRCWFLALGDLWMLISIQIENFQRCSYLIFSPNQRFCEYIYVVHCCMQLGLIERFLFSEIYLRSYQQLNLSQQLPAVNCISWDLTCSRSLVLQATSCASISFSLKWQNDLFCTRTSLVKNLLQLIIGSLRRKCGCGWKWILKLVSPAVWTNK